MVAAPDIERRGTISGPIVRRLREAKGWSRGDLIAHGIRRGLRMSPGRLTEIETSQRSRVTLEIVDILCDVLDVTLEELRG